MRVKNKNLYWEKPFHGMPYIRGNNVNRQSTSSKVGVRIAIRRFILKTRTDIIFNKANFLNVYWNYINSGVTR